MWGDDIRVRCVTDMDAVDAAAGVSAEYDDHDITNHWLHSIWWVIVAYRLLFVVSLVDSMSRRIVCQQTDGAVEQPFYHVT